MNNTKILCDMVNDLLPLYVDGVLSDASKDAVVAHLSKCKKCQQAVDDMTQDIDGLKTNMDQDIHLFKQVQKKFRKKYFLRIALILLVVFIVWVIANIHMMVYYAQVNPKAQAEYIDECLDVVKIGDAYFLHQTDFFAQGEIVVINSENGVWNFYLGENGIHNLGLGRSWVTSPRYQQLFNQNMMDELTIINYCKPDGTVIVTLWKEGEEIPELVVQ